MSMSLSRAESRQRPRSGAFLRWGVAVVLCVICASFVSVLFVRSADTDYRNEENQAIRLAMAQGGLTEVDRAALHTWSEPVWVVTGRDQDGQEWMLWERKDGIVKEKTADGFTESRIRERFDSDRPSAVMLRMLPGWFADQPVWEFRYEKAPKSGRQAIDFYSFKDGKLLQTYDLPSY